MGNSKMLIVLVGKSEKKETFRKFWHKSECNIKSSLKNMGCENINLIHVAEH
jgi:hypothetical protein